jgi:hypothetical protein
LKRGIGSYPVGHYDPLYQYPFSFCKEGRNGIIAMSIQKEHEFNIKCGLAIPAPQKSSFFTEKKDGVCLFCQGPDRGRKRPYKPEGAEFICSACVQTLINADQDYLKRILALAQEHGDKGKIIAIESFIIPEGHNEQIKPKPKFRIRQKRRKKERLTLATA